MPGKIARATTVVAFSYAVSPDGDKVFPVSFQKRLDEALDEGNLFRHFGGNGTISRLLPNLNTGDLEVLKLYLSDLNLDWSPVVDPGGTVVIIEVKK